MNSEMEELLFLVMENDATSASSAGLEQRAVNRAKMRTILQLNLGISDDELNRWYSVKRKLKQIDDREEKE